MSRSASKAIGPVILRRCTTLTAPPLPLPPRHRHRACPPCPAVHCRYWSSSPLSLVPAMENRAPNRAVEDIYVKKTQLEHILLRPDTYIGAVESEAISQWCLDTTSDSIVSRTANMSPGLLKIFDEILVNAADNKQRDASMKELRVWIDPALGTVRVMNDGRGIPIVMHKEHGVYVPELIFGHLLTSSNYDDSQKKTTGGRNGYGAKLANIFSKRFTVKTYDSAKSQLYTQRFERNMSVINKPAIETLTKGRPKSDYTEIEFEPDLSKFPGQQSLYGDALAILSRRVYDIAGTSPTLRVYLNDRLIPCQSFQSYVMKYRGGDDKLVYERVNDRWEIGVACSNDSHFIQMSWVNSIATTRGGTHITYVTDQLVKIITEHIEKRNKKLKVTATQIKNHLAVYVNCLIENPTFDTQTKECLTSKKQSFGSTCEIAEKLAKAVCTKLSIVDNVLSHAAIKENKELSKNDGKKSSRVSGIPKLDDANDAGTKDGHKCTLILTEGDSAKALAVAGLSIIGRDRYGVFPLRGKLLNVREATIKQISENSEFIALKKILGLQQNKVYNDTLSLRYGRVMIMTDQDYDGSHIKGLIINLFAVFWPSLLALPGFLTEFITPIVKVKHGGKKQEMTFFTLPEFQNWKEAQSQSNTLHQWTIKYYKGLGTSTSEEAKKYFSAISRHQLTFNHTQECTKAIELAFGKSLADARKEWLQTWSEDLFLDQSKGSLTYHEFVHKELILFSVASNQRAIPSLVDGFKPGQRKILYACFLKKLKNEIKVAQLAGFVSEKSAYHHGEAALTATIVNMAQDYCGSNNINLLIPNGMFGTRLAGGKDSASARYIFTALSALTKLIFHDSDAPLLHYLNDDGLVIEPSYYLPIIPMVLVNGSSGIGTGWSSSIPNYSPLDLIDAIQAKLNGEHAQSLVPHYRGFHGKIVPSGPSKFTHYGVIEVVNSTTLVISELPLFVWVNDYKLLLEQMLEEQEIKNYREHHTEHTVSFVVTVSEDKFHEFQSFGLHKKFKLVGSLATSNMVLFDEHNKLKRYDTPEQILDEFFVLRRLAYVKRKESLLSALKQDLTKLASKCRFILAVCNDEIKIRQVSKAKVLQQLIAHKYERILAPKKGAKESAEDDDSEDSDDSKSVSDDSSAGYDYLLSMPLWSLTLERVTELTKQKQVKETEFQSLQSMSPDTLWQNDLVALKAAMLRQSEEEKTKELKAIEQSLAGSNPTIGKGKKKVIASKSEMLHGAVVEPPIIDYDVTEPVKEKKKRATKKDTATKGEDDIISVTETKATKTKAASKAPQAPAKKKTSKKIVSEDDDSEDDAFEFGSDGDDCFIVDDDAEMEYEDQPLAAQAKSKPKSKSSKAADTFVSSRPQRAARTASRTYVEVSDEEEEEEQWEPMPAESKPAPTKRTAVIANDSDEESEFDDKENDSESEVELDFAPVKKAAKTTAASKPKSKPNPAAVAAEPAKPNASRAKKAAAPAVKSEPEVVASVVAPTSSFAPGLPMSLSERLALRLKTVNFSDAPAPATDTAPAKITAKRAQKESTGATPAAKRAKPPKAKVPAKSRSKKKSQWDSDDESDASIESLSDSDFSD